VTVQISYTEARRLAECSAKENLSPLVLKEPESWLRESFLEEENCWLFLKSEEIAFSPQGKSWADAAFVVSKRGKLMIIADHDDDLEKLQKCLINVSAYLRRRNE